MINLQSFTLFSHILVVDWVPFLVTSILNIPSRQIMFFQKKEITLLVVISASASASTHLVK